MYRNCIPTFGSSCIGYNFKGRLVLFWGKQSKLCIKEQNIPSHNQRSIVKTCQRGDPRLCLYFCVTKLATRFGESRRTFPGIKSWNSIKSCCFYSFPQYIHNILHFKNNRDRATNLEDPTPTPTRIA